MELPNPAETNGATTLSFLQHLRKLQDAATSLAVVLWGATFGVHDDAEAAVVVVEDDLEAAAPEKATLGVYEEELAAATFGVREDEEAAAAVVVVVEDDLDAGAPEEETNVQTMLSTTSIEQFETVLVKKLMPTFPTTFLYFTLPGLLCLAEIKWQLAPFGFPSPTLHKWYIVCVSSLLTESVASISQWIISAAGVKLSSVYNVIVLLGRIGCFFLFLVSLTVLLYS